jgi:flagellar biosynthesis/type III secretory pathway chaperone
MNLRDLEEHTGLQNALCGELKAWDKASRRTHGIGTQPEYPGRQRWDDLQERLNAALEQVRYLNKVYAALLRRAQRSVQIMDNLLRNSSGSYIGRGAELCRVDSNEVRS